MQACRRLVASGARRLPVNQMLEGRSVPTTTQIIYQPYVSGARGGLKAGPPIACRTAEAGLLRAERALAAGSILGAQIVRVSHDDSAEEFAEPEFLGQVGRVPDAD